MKSAILIFSFCASMVVITALTDQQLEEMKQIRLPCLKAAGLTEEDHKKFHNDKKLLDDSKVKQYLACLYKKIGLITETGDLNVDSLKKKLKTGLNEEKAKEIAEKCAVKKSTPEETSFSLLICLIDNIPHHTNPID